MPRQVKIGFDKVSSPKVKQFQQLVDIFGTPLVDQAGKPLVTEEGAQLSEFVTADQALSSFIANARSNEAIPIEEQFPTESEVSSTLLGVTRAEEQLSLFSDVSTYGLDRSNWNYYIVGSQGYPYQWYNRAHPVFGNRGDVRFYEGTDEQALYLKSFPVQYGWPGHPRRNLDNQPDYSDNFGKYLKFLALGRWLYEVWKDVDRVFADNNFISDCLTFQDRQRNPIPITFAPSSSSPLNVWDSAKLGGGFKNIALWRTVVYGSETNNSSQFSMDQIEKWQLFYYRIQNDIDSYPPYLYNGTSYDFKYEGYSAFPIPGVGQYSNIRAWCSPDVSRPGGTDQNESIGVLESKKSFRYQPGRVSGFTFGLRLKNNRASTADKVEWGAANETDQYMFQASGTRLNIVRRSVNAIPNEVITGRYRMKESDQTGPAVPPSRDNSQPMYTLTIPREKWNGDPLDGTGESGYSIDVENVAMYKIEYSWYGAIGAKFYAYIPIGSGECRWVRMHTLVIENQLNEPALKNADFKFRYVLQNKVTKNLTEPTFVYKYGSSYYIDGGDEGTVTINSVTSDTKTFTASTTLPATGSIVGIHPKEKIYNSFGINNSDPNSQQQDATYDGIRNNKKIYPLTLNAFSSNDVRIDISQIRVSPDGHHGSKSVDLYSGTAFEKDIKFNIVQEKTKISLTADSPDSLTYLDQKVKIIGDGLYNMYIKDIDTTSGSTAQGDVIRRNSYVFTGSSFINELNDLVIKPDGTEVDFTTAQAEQHVFETKAVGYRSIVASDTPISSGKFKIHFLNPRRRGSYFYDFAIGVTSDAPSTHVDSSTGTNLGYLRFGDENGFRVYPENEPATEPTTGLRPFKLDDQLHVEWANSTHVANLMTGADNSESDSPYGTRLEQDYRIRGMELPFSRRLSNGQIATNGVLSCIQGEVRTISYEVEQIDSVIPGDIDADRRIIFRTGNVPPITSGYLNIAEVGVMYNEEETATGYVFVSEVLPNQEVILTGQSQSETVTRNVVYVKDSGGGNTAAIDAVPDNGTGKILGKVVTLTDDNKLTGTDNRKNFSYSQVFRFNAQPLYMFVAMKSNARINNIIVEEIGALSSTTHVPNFRGHDLDSSFSTTSNITLRSDPGVSSANSPSNFLSIDPLAAVTYDTQTTNPLVDGVKLYSFYVGENESVKFDLDNIFGYDRAFLTSGLYNNTAYAFTAQPIIPTGDITASADVQMTITSKEQ